MPTGEQVRLAVGRELNRALGERALWEVVNSGTVATSLTDATRLLSTRFTSQQFQDWIARVTSGNRDGDLSYCRALTASSGLLGVSPAFSGVLANTDTLELWSPKAPHPDEIDQAIDEALQHLCVRQRLVPLSYAVDSDFVASGVTNWTGSSATASKAERTGLERFTEQVLRVLNSGANGYAGQTINVRESERWYVFALAQADVGTAALILYDLDGSAAISLTNLTRSTWSGESFQAMRGPFTIPAGCERFSVRLGGQGASDDTYWANLCIYPQDAREFVLPARVINKGAVGEFVEYAGDDWPEQYTRPLQPQPDIEDVGGGQVRVILRDDAGERAIFWHELANYAALRTAYNTSAGRLAGDAAETDCPLEYVKWAALYTLYPDRFAREWERVKFEHTQRPVPRVKRPQGSVSA